jgi:hypothetical protein
MFPYHKCLDSCLLSKNVRSDFTDDSGKSETHEFICGSAPGERPGRAQCL